MTETAQTAQAVRYTTTVIQKLSTFENGATKAMCEIYIGQNLIALGEAASAETARINAAGDLSMVVAALHRTISTLEES